MPDYLHNTGNATGKHSYSDDHPCTISINMYYIYIIDLYVSHDISMYTLIAFHHLKPNSFVRTAHSR